jgi:CBS domain containing-hemolysin-like protein
VSDLLKTFQAEKNHMAIVVDEYGMTSGLVTIEDVLEEIVGDIQDEYDQEMPDYQTEADGTIIANAKMDLDDLAEILDMEFPEEDVETLGGFISFVSGTVPEIGEKVTYDNLTFEILDSNERRIERVKIIREPKEIENSQENNNNVNKEIHH